MFEFSEFELDDGPNGSPRPAQDFYIPQNFECMSCGLCVPQCPTYKHFQIAEETPRNRLRSLDEILNHDRLPDDDALRHLDNCVQCLGCETVCPSKVEYGFLYDKARQKLETMQPSPWWKKWMERQLLDFLAQKKRQGIWIHVLAVYQKSGLQRLVRRLPLLQETKTGQAEALIPELDRTELKTFYLTESEKRGSVALFTGCMGSLFDRQTALASIRVLNRLGFDVIIPKEQGCCGAAHQHTGNDGDASALAYQNIGIFNALSVDAVVYSASACGLMLNEYPQLEIRDFDDEEIRFFQDSLTDISDFILQHWPDDTNLNTVGKKVLLHEPCSQRNGLKNQQSAHDLLQKIPGLELTVLDGVSCCGAGGVNMLLNPAVSNALRKPVIETISLMQPDELATSNIGCSLHLQAGLEMNSQKINVKHPVSLIAEALC